MGQNQTGVVFRPLFRDNFNRYESDLFPGGGWLQGLQRIQGEAKNLGEALEEGGRMQQKASAEATAAVAVVDDRIYASSSGSFKLEGTQEEPGSVVKRFSVPERIPFSVSADTFSIVESGGEAQAERAARAEFKGEKGKEGKRQKRGDGSAAETGRRRASDRRLPGSTKSEARSIRQGVLKEPGGVKMLSGVLPNGTYYIYSFDGRLLAEYNVFGHWVRDYVYFGGQLVAEYRATEQGSKYYYYASDQINSTRIVTDNTGAVVYSAAHEPYGGIQKTWTADLDLELKFSGKPRDSESELDYFGARYYDRAQYRFISTDPTTRRSSSGDSQRWNLYSYCSNRPISWLDPDGKDLIPVFLNGIGSTYLDSVLYAGLSPVIDYCKANGINLVFSCSPNGPGAYRTAEEQQAMRASNPGTAALGVSLHEAGLAVDILWNLLSAREQRIVARCLKQQGLTQGTSFGEPWHWYIADEALSRARTGLALYASDLKEMWEYIRAVGDFYERLMAPAIEFLADMANWELTGSFLPDY